MQSQPLLLKVPVVIFAVLVGSIFVYARAGGSLPFLNRPAQVSPAAVQDANEPGGGPAIMMGSKSAPAFLPEERSSPPAQTVGRLQRAPSSLPNVAPNSVPETRSAPRLLPGSKSIILADPPPLPAQLPSNQGNR